MYSKNCRLIEELLLNQHDDDDENMGVCRRQISQPKTAKTESRFRHQLDLSHVTKFVNVHASP